MRISSIWIHVLSFYLTESSISLTKKKKSSISCTQKIKTKEIRLAILVEIKSLTRIVLMLQDCITKSVYTNKRFTNELLLRCLCLYGSNKLLLHLSFECSYLISTTLSLISCVANCPKHNRPKHKQFQDRAEQAATSIDLRKIDPLEIWKTSLDIDTMKSWQDCN